MREYYVYILASKRNGTLYVGMTKDLRIRVTRHKKGLASKFTKKHGVDKLVYYERHNSNTKAEERERLIKKWNRTWKIRLIEQNNPKWNNLFQTFELA